MWTYLAIFFSAAVVVGVFMHRVFANKKKLVQEVAVEAAEAEKAAKEAEESEEERKIRLSREQKDEVESLCKRGESLISSGKDEEAVKCFVQALSINAQHPETQQRLALLYLQKQMYSAAAALFQQLAEQTKDPVHYSHWGLTLYQQSDFENAKIAYQTAVDLDPSRPQRFVSLAQVYKALGQLGNAIIAVNKALEIEQENLEFLYLLADLQVEAGNYLAARESLEKLLTLDAGNKAALAMLKEIRRIESAANGA
ncbi:tetratricopeptide repeat protein [Candidatus Peregrinibacteria bacterium]|nr:tetratricopeptide repeat protein [Candidatus Peregrinibacteria bacterium]